MHNTSEVLIRNYEYFNQGKVLFVGLSDPDLLSSWKSSNYLLWTNNWNNKNQFSKLIPQESSIEFSYLLPSNDSIKNIDQVIIILPKSRELLNFWLAQLNATLTIGTKVYLVGEKNSGIQGASKQLKQYLGTVAKLDMARHCQLWEGQLETQQEFNLDVWVKQFIIPHNDLALFSIPGVFNHGKLDEGTQLLLDNLGCITTGRILDFGCGAGVLGLSLKSQQALCTVDMLDVSAEAIYATQYSANKNDLDVTVFPSDGLSEVKGRYHQIFSNPPFHTGIKTDYEIVERFIEKSAAHLIEGGELRIVANAFLKYPALIEKYVGRCTVIAETTKFKVYSARKHK